MMYAFMLTHKIFFFFSSSISLIIINRSKLFCVRKIFFGLSKFIVKKFHKKMCSQKKVPSLMMQPQEYCSCVVCGTCTGNSKKFSTKVSKKCTFDESESDTSYQAPSTKASRDSCQGQTTSEDSARDTECTEKSKRKSSKRASKMSSMTSCKTDKTEQIIEALCPPDEPFDCNNEFTPSGMCPPKTTGPLGKRFDCCSKYAPCGHWSTCTDKGHQHDKLFDACETCEQRGNFFIVLKGIFKG